MNRRALRQGWGFTLVVAIAVSACSSSSSSSSPSSSALPSTSPESVEADADVVKLIEQFGGAGVSGAIKGTVDVSGQSGPIRGRFSGTKLATDGRGTLTGVSPGELNAPLDAVWRDGQLASKRTAGVGFGVWPTPLVVQSAGTPLPPVAPMGVFASSIEPVFPPALLGRIENLKPDQDEKITIAGKPARRVTFSYLDSTFNRRNRVTLTLLDGPRLYRVKVETEVGDLTSVLDYRVTMRKDGPLDVELPGGGIDSPAALAPEGPYVEKLAGSAPGVEWRVLRAPGRPGIECWRVESTPPIAVSAPNFEDARCLAELSTKDPTPDQVEVVLSSDGSASPAVIVGRVPAGASQARLGFPGGKLVSVPIKDGLIVWAGDNDANPVYLQLKLDGELVECGTGAVARRADLKDPQIADVRLGLAWTCDIW